MGSAFLRPKNVVSLLRNGVLCVHVTGGGPSIAEGICNQIGLVDRFFDKPANLSAWAVVDGEFWSGATKSWDGQGTPPFFMLEVGGEVEIVSFRTSPFDPAPFQSYVATAEIICAGPETLVTMTIVGTDGYRDSFSMIIEGTETLTLFVPGAEDGIVDLITVEIDGGPDRAIVLTF